MIIVAYTGKKYSILIGNPYTNSLKLRPIVSIDLMSSGFKLVKNDDVDSENYTLMK